MTVLWLVLPFGGLDAFLLAQSLCDITYAMAGVAFWLSSCRRLAGKDLWA